MTICRISAILLNVVRHNNDENKISGCAGIGRQARLRGVCQQTYGFKSHQPHQLLKKISFMRSFFYASDRDAARLYLMLIIIYNKILWSVYCYHHKTVFKQHSICCCKNGAEAGTLSWMPVKRNIWKRSVLKI